MVKWYMYLPAIACVVLYATFRGLLVYMRAFDRRINNERLELLKWQRELEDKASEIRKIQK